MSFISAFTRKLSLSGSIAVDLGTANTVVWQNGQVVLNEPSIIAYAKSREKIIAIGNDAKVMLGKTSVDIQIIKPMKDGVIADPKIAEEMLKQFITQIKTSYHRKMIVCVPAGATPAELNIVRNSCELAGGKNIDLISEPMAAAIGLGLDVLKPEGNMIIDIGGGTTEIAVIATGGIVCNQSVKIAGDRLTQCVRDYFKNEHDLLIGENVAEGIKEEAGSATVMDKNFEEQEVRVKGKNVTTGLPTLASALVKDIREKALDQPIKEIIYETKKLLGCVDEQLSKDIYERGIWLTGGGAKLKGLLERLREETDLPVQRPDPKDLDPLLAVVNGTAKVLQEYNKYKQCLLKNRI